MTPAALAAPKGEKCTIKQLIAFFLPREKRSSSDTNIKKKKENTQGFVVESKLISITVSAESFEVKMR